MKKNQMLAGMLAMAVVLTSFPVSALAGQTDCLAESVSVNSVEEETELIDVAEEADDAIDAIDEVTEAFSVDEDGVEEIVEAEYAEVEYEVDSPDYEFPYSGSESDIDTDEVELVGAVNTSEYETDFNKVAATVRANLLKRKSCFSVKVVTTKTILQTRDDIMKRVYANNGDYNGGDYLKDSVSGFRLSMSRHNGKYATLNFGSSEASLYIRYKTTLSQEQAINNWVNQKVASYSGPNDTESKIRWIEETISNTVTYDGAGDPATSSYSAYGAIQGKAVCKGYVLIMYKMCTKMGISTRVITHIDAKRGSNYSHAWNIVKVGDKYYNIDVTWDDQTEDKVSKISRLYYLKNEEDFRYNDRGLHVRDSQFTTVEFNRECPMSSTSYVVKEESKSSGNSKSSTTKNTTTSSSKSTQTSNSTSKSSSSSASSSSKVAMYRLYNKNSGEHFYTASKGEKDSLVKVGWKYEGIGWYAPKTSSTPVYRLYNPNSGDHHYTTGKSERNMLKKAGWRYEGIGWYSAGKSGVALLRQYNPNAKTGSHNFTTSKAENDSLVKAGWKYEGIAWYGLK